MTALTGIEGTTVLAAGVGVGASAVLIVLVDQVVVLPLAVGLRLD